MYPEYLFNSDTQDICRRVSDLATSNESALRAHCQEVSRQTDTSSRTLLKDCAAKVCAAQGTFDATVSIFKELSQSLSSESGVFGTQNGQAAFAKVCRAVVQVEEERQHLLSAIADLTRLRRELASSVAEANRVLHFLSMAKCAVLEDLCLPYAEALELAQKAYARLTAADASLCEVQKFYMTLIESHLPVFMSRLRVAADFNHTGAALDAFAIRALCGELFILQNRTPNVSF